jgi:hypothetical protein
VPKRKTLPKDFEALLEAGDLAALRAVFDKCEVDARGGYAKQTAIAFPECPDELVRWLVEHGADLQAPDTHGYTPLHTRARYWKSSVASLIALGADVHAMHRSGTPLHVAAESFRAKNAELLIAAGADVNRKDERGYLPLELCLFQAAPGYLIDAFATVKVLLGAGATRTPGMHDSISKLGKQYEFHRGNISDDIAQATSDALDQLYGLFDVPPVARRRHHDGTSPIVPTATTWQKQHAELWDLLVPSRGAAATVQGELIRIAGKVGREVADNGAVNWGVAWIALSRQFGKLVELGTALGDADARDARSIVASLVTEADCDIDRMAQLAVAWVLRNPTPLALGPVEYDI